jgi:tetratricopeptide (TPR) repeat protein
MNVNRVVTVILVVSALFLPVLAADAINQTSDPWYWYNKAVDLANEGKYSEALQANEQALAFNESFPLAQANKAGILVQLGRYDEAIVAADKALAIRSNTTAAFAAAYSNKGDALRHLGRIEEAKVAFAKAFELDNTLTPPDLSQATILPTTPAKSPVGWITAPIAISLVTLFVGLRYRKRK